MGVPLNPAAFENVITLERYNPVTGKMEVVSVFDRLDTNSFPYIIGDLRPGYYRTRLDSIMFNGVTTMITNDFDQGANSTPFLNAASSN